VTVRVITDSAAALGADMASQHGVVVVPIRVVIAGTAYRDGDVPLSEVVSRVHDGVTTSGPPPGAFLEALEGAEDGAVVVTVAGTLSSTLVSAGIAAGRVPIDVRVVDTGSAAGAQALVALHAARVAARGARLEDVEVAARRVAGRARLIGMLETLDYLVRGGRVNNIVGLAGRVGVRPLFELAGGKIHRLRPAFSSQGGRRRMLSEWRRSRTTPGARAHVVALHAMAEEGARRLLDAVRQECDPATAMVSEFGAGMVVHTGPGLLGLSWWWEDEP
jgi:DegV family protein with EDD domain